MIHGKRAIGVRAIESLLYLHVYTAFNTACSVCATATCFFYISLLLNKDRHRQELEMCQYNTDAPAKGPTLPRNEQLAKTEVEKSHNSHNNWWILP